MSGIAQTVSCLDGYDPDALRVDKAREAIRACLAPVTRTERVPVRQAPRRGVARAIVPAAGGPPGQKAKQNVRYAGEARKAGAPVRNAGRPVRPAELGLLASLGLGEVSVKRK